MSPPLPRKSQLPIAKSTQRSITSFFASRTTDRQTDIESYATWGDHISPDKLGYFRAIFNNVNGISPRDQFAKAHIIGMSADTLQADFIGMAETNTQWTHNDIRERCTKVFRNYWHKSKITTSSSIIGFGTTFQPGGTMSIVGNAWYGRSKVSCDSPLGRWTSCTISGKQARQVTIITAYNVCNASITTCGPMTAYSQQYHILKRTFPGRDPDPRAAFWRDLSSFITTLRTTGHEIVLMIDANDTLQKHNSKLTKWVRDSGLLDVHMHYHGTDDEPATHSRGTNRIDYIFTSPTITEYVEHCGILPLHDICFSDHRPLYVDIDLLGYLGGHIAHPLHHVSRGIVTTDPRTVRQYQHHIEQAFTTSDLEEKVAWIQSEMERMTTDPSVDTELLCTKLEDVDIQFLAIRLECELKSKNDNQFPWSPTLQRASFNKTFWATWLSQLRSNGRHNFHDVRVRFVTDDTSSFLDRSDITIQEASAMFKRAILALSDVQVRAQEFRDHFLDEKAKMAQDEGEIELARIIIAIKAAEARQRIWNKLKRIKGKYFTSGIDHVIDIDSDGNQTQIHEPDAMFAALIDRNQRHFSQADGTPFTVEPLASLLGPYGTSDYAQQLLDGTADIASLPVSEATQAILEQLRKKPDHSPIPVSIEKEDLIAGYMKWGEFTTTSPSGLHLGHDKAMLKLRSTQEKAALEKSTMPTYQKYFQIKAVLLDSAISLGHVYARWKKVVNALIEKVPGLPLLGKLRVIHLIESDFNLLIGILWGRRLVWEAEDKEIFHDGQGGSRPGRRAQEQVIQKHSIYSILRMSKTNGASFDNDAKSCYDRIVMPLASLCSQQIGMPKPACELFLKTLQSIHYHVKTSHGISDQSYCTTSDATIHGPGQGGRGSPAIWVAISSILMQCMENHCDGAKLTSPYGRNRDTLFWLTGFVDDVTHWCISQRRSEADICSNLHKAAQWWEELLHSSGGKLELSKCFFYIMIWDFDEEGIASIRPISKFTQQIVLTDSETHEPVLIPQRSCSESHKTLGVMETPDGNNIAEFNRLHKLSNSHGQRVATGRLSRIEAAVYYQSTYISSISYGMIIGTMSQTQLEKIQSAARQSMISAMGFNQCSPLPIVHGPKDLGGFGIQDLYTRQGSDKTLFLICLLRTNRQASITLRLQLEWAQRISGISQSIWQDVSTKIPQLHSELWITTLRHFLHKSQLQLVIPDLQPSELLREHDSYLMDHIPRKQSNGSVIMINRCRLYLRATTLADITNTSGTEITDAAWNYLSDGQGITSGHWPHQPRPGPQHKSVWQTFLQSLCEDNTQILLRPLGKWLSHHTRHVRGTTLFVESLTQSMYYMSDDQWWKDTIVPHRLYHSVAGTPIECEAPDINSLLPATLHPHGVHDHLLWTDAIHNHAIHSIPLSWSDYVSTLVEWKQYLIGHHDIFADLSDFATILGSTTATIVCVSDGSSAADQRSGTYAWIISTDQFTIASGFGKVPGQPVSSFRSECFGKLAWLTFLNEFRSFYQINTHCVIQSYCDNKGVVDRSATHITHQQLSHTLVPSYDALREISIQQMLLQLAHNTIHVRGHQDRAKKTEDLTEAELLNIEADKLAGEAVSYFSNHPKYFQQYLLPHGGPFLQVDGDALWSNEQRYLRWRYSEFQLQEYYIDKFHISRATLFDINWIGLRLARQTLTPGPLNFSIKYGIDWLATGKQTARYGHLVTECILCGAEETNIHLLLCPNRLNDMVTALGQFQAYLREIDTEPGIAAVLVTEISRHFVIPFDTSALTVPNDQAYTNASKSQYAISWYRFVRGYLSNAWAVLQDAYLVANKSSKLGDSWSAKVGLWWIKKSYDIWISRNNCVHSDQPGLQNRQEAELFARVQQLYKLAEQLPAADREMLDLPIEDRLLQPIETLKHWLDLTRVTIDNSIQAYRVRLRQRHTPINDIFQQPISPSTTTAAPTAPQRKSRRTTRPHVLRRILRPFRRNAIAVSNPTTTTPQSVIRRIFTRSQTRTTSVAMPSSSVPTSLHPPPMSASPEPTSSIITRSRSSRTTRSREATHDQHSLH